MVIRHRNKGFIIKRRARKRNLSGLFAVSKKIVSVTCISGILLTMNLPIFSAFEAHVINVTAEICKDMGRTATIGYWKNHPEDYMPHLPMYLNSELISNESEANFILDYGYDADNMMNKLKGQLLAMKFGVVHFGVGDYFLEKEEDVFAGVLEDLENTGGDTQGILDYFETGDGKTFNEIVADAEDMLAVGPVPDDEELEAMKNLIDRINNLHEIRYCALPPPEIILNEFLPNPCGDDDAPMSGGEWVELYNNSDADIDAAGWYLYDSYNDYPLEITPERSDNNGDTADTGETVVPSKGWLVVYLNGEYNVGWLNNTGGDSIRLYDGEIAVGMLISSYTYTSDASLGKSFARIPDGIGEWVDPVPTPGAPNMLEEYPAASSSSASDVANIASVDDKDGDDDGNFSGVDDENMKDENEDDDSVSEDDDTGDGDADEDSASNADNDSNIDDETGQNGSTQENGTDSDDIAGDLDSGTDDEDLDSGADNEAKGEDSDDAEDTDNNDDADDIPDHINDSTQEYETNSEDETNDDIDIVADNDDAVVTDDDISDDANDSSQETGTDSEADDTVDGENSGDLSPDPDDSTIEFKL